MEIADWVKAYQGNDDPKFFNDDYWNEKIYRHEEKNEIAKNLFSTNLSLEEISYATGLSIEEINKLKNGE